MIKKSIVGFWGNISLPAPPQISQACVGNVEPWVYIISQHSIKKEIDVPNIPLSNDN